jgi:predicted dehydrogenase
LALARERGRIGAVMHGYSGYPLVRQMRAMVGAGELGRIRVVQAEFAHGGHAGPVEREVPALAWRYDPEVAGPSSALADAGSHALHMASYVTGRHVAALSALFASHGAGRRLEDDAHLHLRFDGGAVGALWASAVALGNPHGLRLRVYGDRAGMEWAQERPNQLAFTPLGEPTRTLERGSPYLHREERRASRIGAGHAEGYFEGFANIYRDLADAIAGGEPGPYPDLAAGAHGVAVIEAAVASAASGGAWVAVARA